MDNDFMPNETVAPISDAKAEPSQNASNLSTPNVSASHPRWERKWFQRSTVYVLIIFMLLVLLSWGYFSERMRLDEFSGQWSAQVSQTEKFVQQAQEQAQNQQKQLHDLYAKQTLLSERFVELERQQQQFETLYSHVIQGSAVQILADWESTLTLAASAVQSTGDYKAAIGIAQLLQNRMQNYRDKRWQALKLQLTQDIQALEKIKDLDPRSRLPQLSLLMNHVEAFPLRYTRRPLSTQTQALQKNAESWKGFLSELWQDLTNLVRIEKTGARSKNSTASALLLSSEQEGVLRANIQLHLASARLALLANNASIWRSELQAAQQLLRRYFDDHTQEVGNAIEELNSLSETQFYDQQNSFSATLTLIHSLRRSFETGAK